MDIAIVSAGSDCEEDAEGNVARLPSLRFLALFSGFSRLTFEVVAMDSVSMI